MPAYCPGIARPETMRNRLVSISQKKMLVIGEDLASKFVFFDEKSVETSGYTMPCSGMMDVALYSGRRVGFGCQISLRILGDRKSKVSNRLRFTEDSRMMLLDTPPARNDLSRRCSRTLRPPADLAATCELWLSQQRAGCCTVQSEQSDSG